MQFGLFEQRGFGSAYRRYRYHVHRRFNGGPRYVSIGGPFPSGCVPGKDAGVVRAGFGFSLTGAPGIWVLTGPALSTGLFCIMPVGITGLIWRLPVVRAGLC